MKASTGSTGIFQVNSAPNSLGISTGGVDPCKDSGEEKGSIATSVAGLSIPRCLANSDLETGSKLSLKLQAAVINNAIKTS